MGRVPTAEEVAMILGAMNQNIDETLGSGGGSGGGGGAGGGDRTPTNPTMLRCEDYPVSQLNYRASTAADALLLDRARAIHGDRCDECGVKPAAGSGAALNICGRCRQRWYCGRACQATHWKAGHKKVCRKKGAFKPGDRVVFIGLVTRADLNGLMGTVRAQVAGGAGGDAAATRWQVTTSTLAGIPPETLSIKPDNLMYLME